MLYIGKETIIYNLDAPFIGMCHFYALNFTINRHGRANIEVLITRLLSAHMPVRDHGVHGHVHPYSAAV